MKNIFTIRLISVVLLAIMHIVPAKAQQITIIQKRQNDTANSEVSYTFSLKEALKMPQYAMRTSTNWTGEELFSGVRMSAVLKRFDLHGKFLHFFCIDGYDHRVPMSDVNKYDLLLAYERNGKMMSIRSLGPFALIYPRSKYPVELGGVDTDAKFIWMIKKIYIE